ncbi:hypothetical protein TNCV_2702781 [Trichonephila clavipes]|nr:hypothetical protein TNCV_2702781 [Trichonephila clavipes]
MVAYGYGDNFMNPWTLHVNKRLFNLVEAFDDELGEFQEDNETPTRPEFLQSGSKTPLLDLGKKCSVKRVCISSRGGLRIIGELLKHSAKSNASLGVKMECTKSWEPTMKDVSYLTIIRSAIRPVPHRPDLAIPSPPDTLDNILDDLDQISHISSDSDDGYDPGTNDPELFSQSDLNDLVRDLGLPKDTAEVLGSRLKERHLLNSGVSF